MGHRSFHPRRQFVRWVLLGILLAACGPGRAGRAAMTPSGDQARQVPLAATTLPTAGPTRMTAPVAVARADDARPTAPHDPAAFDPWLHVGVHGGDSRPAVPTPGSLGILLKVAHLSTIDGAPELPGLPIALAVDRHGHLYVADARSHRIHKYDRDGHLLLAWGGHGTDDGQFRFGFGDTAACASAQDACGFAAGGGLAVDERDHVYVADWANHRIQKFDSNGRLLTRWGRVGVAPGEFFLPSGIAADGQGGIYVADSGNQRVQRFDHDGRFLGQWGGQGRIAWPTGLAVDGAGRVWVADGWNGRVQAFDEQGHPLAEGATGNLVRGDAPEGPRLAVDRDGRIYVGGAGAPIQVFDADGRRLGSWDRDWRGEGRLLRPSGLAVDADGDVYVADRETGHIHKFRPLLPVTG